MKYLLEYLDDQDEIQPIGIFDSMKEIDQFLEDLFRIRGEFPNYTLEYEESGMMYFDFGAYTATYYVSEIGEDNEVQA